MKTHACLINQCSHNYPNGLLLMCNCALSRRQINKHSGSRLVLLKELLNSNVTAECINRTPAVATEWTTFAVFDILCCTIQVLAGCHSSGFTLAGIIKGWDSKTILERRPFPGNGLLLSDKFENSKLGKKITEGLVFPLYSGGPPYFMVLWIRSTVSSSSCFWSGTKRYSDTYPGTCLDGS